MSYSVSIYGHGAPPAAVQEAFESAVRTIRAAHAEGTGGPQGSMSANGADGTSISLMASDVAEEPEGET